MASKLSLFLAEFRRRKVGRVAVVYALVGLGVIEGASMILPTLQLEAAYDYIVIFVLFGFPIALVLAWALEVTPQGIQKTPDLTPEQLAAQTPQKWRASSWVLSGVGLVVVLGAGYFVLLRGGEEPGPRDELATEGFPEDYVAVFPFENLTGNPTFDDLGWYIADWITSGLTGVQEVRQVAASTVEEVLSRVGDSLTRLEVAEGLGVGIAVTGLIASSGDSLELRAEIIRVPDGDLIQPIGVLGSAEDPRDAVGSMRDQVMGALSILLDEYSALTGSRPPTLDAFQAYRQGWERWLAGDFAGAVPHYEESYRQDSTWIQSAVVLFVAYLATQQDSKRDSLRVWVDSRRLDLGPSERTYWDAVVATLEGDLEAQYEVARSRFRMDPTGNALNLAVMAVQVGRPREALQAMEHVDLSAPIWRDFPPQWTFVPSANHMLGQYEEELEAARQGRERFPEFLTLRRFEIQALVAMNRLEETSPLLDQVEGMEPDSYGSSPGGVFRSIAGVLARFGHHEESKVLAERALNWYLTRNPDGYQRSRAQALILAERPAEALALLGPLVEESPDNVTFHGLHGIALALTGDREGAEAEEEWLEELDRSYLQGLHTGYRAAIAAHLDRRDEAVRIVRQALQEGRSYEQLSMSPDLKPLWGYEPFEQLIAPKG